MLYGASAQTNQRCSENIHNQRRSVSASGFLGIIISYEVQIYRDVGFLVVIEPSGVATRYRARCRRYSAGRGKPARQPDVAQGLVDRHGSADLVQSEQPAKRKKLQPYIGECDLHDLVLPRLDQQSNQGRLVKLEFQFRRHLGSSKRSS